MTDLDERNDSEMDGLLRRSLAGPVPRLGPEFDQRLMRELRGGSRSLGRAGRILLAGYGVISVAASAVVMRGQGLEWGTVAGVTLVPLAVVGIVAWARRGVREAVESSAG